MTPLVLLILLMGGPKPPKAPKVPPPEKLSVSLIVSPIGIGQAPWYVDVRIRAYDPQHELSCPSWRVVCNDHLEHHSRGLSDCEDPFPRPEDRPVVYRLPERAPVRCGPYVSGEHLIVAELTDGTHGPGQARAAVVTKAAVTVAGPPPPPAQVASR